MAVLDTQALKLHARQNWIANLEVLAFHTFYFCLVASGCLFLHCSKCSFSVWLVFVFLLLLLCVPILAFTKFALKGLVLIMALIVEIIAFTPCLVVRLHGLLKVLVLAFGIWFVTLLMLGFALADTATEETKEALSEEVEKCKRIEQMLSTGSMLPLLDFYDGRLSFPDSIRHLIELDQGHPTLPQWTVVDSIEKPDLGLRACILYCNGVLSLVVKGTKLSNWANLKDDFRIFCGRKISQKGPQVLADVLLEAKHRLKRQGKPVEAMIMVGHSLGCSQIRYVAALLVAELQRLPGFAVLVEPPRHPKIPTGWLTDRTYEILGEENVITTNDAKPDQPVPALRIHLAQGFRLMCLRYLPTKAFDFFVALITYLSVLLLDPSGLLQQLGLFLRVYLLHTLLYKFLYYVVVISLHTWKNHRVCEFRKAIPVGEDTPPEDRK